MKVSIIGTGYVGLVSGTCFAELGHSVTCIDINPKIVETLQSGKATIYEPGLSDLLTRNIKENRLFFSTEYDSIKDADFIFLAVGTPQADDGAADLKYIFSALDSIAAGPATNAAIVIKSTVPVGTHNKVQDHLATKGLKLKVLNNPEFLKEGDAISDFMKPDRIVIGSSDQAAGEKLKELYEPLTRQGNPIYVMSNQAAELTKYAANCFLATKISFINEIARLCDVVGAEIEEVRAGMCSDSRIGKKFLYPGPGYGGSCFPKDVQALLHTSKEVGSPLKIIDATEDVNREQKTYILNKINRDFNSDLNGKRIAVWGLAFKPKTDDVRESPALDVVKNLLTSGATVYGFDPVAGPNFTNQLKIELEKSGANTASSMENFHLAPDRYSATEGAEALVIMTEWSEFKTIDFDKLGSQMKNRKVFDGRNIVKPDTLKAGFEYFGIGQ